MGRRAADHALGLGTDGQHALGAVVHGHHARLGDDDAAVPDDDQRVGGPQVDPDVMAEEAEQAVEESQGCLRSGASAGPWHVQGPALEGVLWCVRALPARVNPSTRWVPGREPRTERARAAALWLDRC
jgi:hypothetical protein